MVSNKYTLFVCFCQGTLFSKAHMQCDRSTDGTCHELSLAVCATGQARLNTTTLVNRKWLWNLTDKKNAHRNYIEGSEENLYNVLPKKDILIFDKQYDSNKCLYCGSVTQTQPEKMTLKC